MLFSVTLPFVSYARDGAGSDSLARALVRGGYENVVVVKRNDTLFVGFENRRYRWEVRAVAEVLALVMPALGDREKVSLTCLYEGIPMSTLVVAKADYHALAGGSMTPGAFATAVQGLLSTETYKAVTATVKPVNKPYNKIDFVIHPLFRAQFGNFSDPLEMQFSIVPSAEVTFMKGMHFTAQVIVPLYNDLEPQGSYVRPGLVVLSQQLRLPHNFFATLAAGYFTRNQYGMNAALRKYLLNGKVGLGVDAGYTATAMVVDGEWVYSTTGRFTWFAGASYRWARYDFTASAGYGRFLAGDMGFRCDISRQFGEVTMGFWASQSGGITNGGFNFIVPLPPRRCTTKHRVRVRPASEVPWEYRAKGLPVQGRMYTTGTGTGDIYRQLNPDYLRNNIANTILHSTKP
jgi:hypothetical protein